MPTATLKCCNCKERYKRELMLKLPAGNFCGMDCAYEYANKKATAAREKAQRAKDKAKRDKLKTRGEWLKEAQIAFNAFIRERDKKEPCISCQRKTGAKMNAGHYRSVGAHPELRFNEDNVHIQCEHCNNFKSGNAIDYRINLIKKIGLKRVEHLEGHHEIQKLTIEQIKGLKEKYKGKLKALKNS